MHLLNITINNIIIYAIKLLTKLQTGISKVEKKNKLT